MTPVWKDLLVPQVPWYSLIIRAVIAWLSVLILLRLAGKRQVAQMGMAEFVALLLISNAVQNSMNGGDNSLVGGLLLAAVLIILTHLFSYLTYRFRKLEVLVQGRPTLLIHHGQLVQHALQKELLTVTELRHLLRKQGIHELREIEEAVLEPDGFVSIVKKNEVPEEPDPQRNDVY
jgi:uncharacterized membrane protein YcaP (DUF421 family)